MLRQFIRSAIRDCAVCRIGDLCPSSSPATTTLITPEAWISSATTYAANGVRKLSAAVDHRVGHVLADEPDHEEERQPDGNPAAGGDEEVECQCLPRHRRDDRGAQRNQRGGVVEQRLPLEDRHDATRKPDAAPDRRRSHGVRRRDHRTDREGCGPAEVGQERVHQHGDTHGRERDQTDREQQDRASVGVEVDEAGLERRGVQQRRQQPEEHHLGLQLHVGDERQVGADHPDHDQDERGGQVESGADTGDGDDHGDDPDQCEDDVHALIIANAAPAFPDAASLRRCRSAPLPGWPHVSGRDWLRTSAAMLAPSTLCRFTHPVLPLP